MFILAIETQLPSKFFVRVCWQFLEISTKKIHKNCSIPHWQKFHFKIPVSASWSNHHRNKINFYKSHLPPLQKSHQNSSTTFEFSCWQTHGQKHIQADVTKAKRQRHCTWYSATYRCAEALSQPRKWQLDGIGYSTAAQASAAHCPCNRLWTRSYAAIRTTPQSATLGLHPVIHVPNYMVRSSAFTPRPPRDGWLSWPYWLTNRGQLNHKVVTHPASILVQDRRSSPVETSVLTTMLRPQQNKDVDCVHTSTAI